MTERKHADRWKPSAEHRKNGHRALAWGMWLLKSMQAAKERQKERDDGGASGARQTTRSNKALCQNQMLYIYIKVIKSNLWNIFYGFTILSIASYVYVNVFVVLNRDRFVYRMVQHWANIATAYEETEQDSILTHCACSHRQSKQEIAALFIRQWGLSVWAFEAHQQTHISQISRQNRFKNSTESNGINQAKCYR